ncbi:uncharacterized protein LOC135351471 [Halichondria panicea]|uniref:uncharacterized protein LOC135351471 n=1 Tax=Halichondria panicea TaxID=6063 RepID=UPI00312B5C01
MRSGGVSDKQQEAHKMKLYLLSALLFLACTDAVLGGQPALTWLKNLQGIIATHAAQGHRLHKRQSDACNTDITESFSPSFQLCQQELTDVLSFSADEAEVTKFCHDKCGPLVIDFSERLAKDCGIPDAAPDMNVKEIINSTCLYGPGNTLCALLWRNVLMNPPQTYYTCISDYVPGQACPDSCKTAEAWVNTNVGCCYRAYLDFLDSQGADEGVLTDDFWTTCGVKEPQKCLP